MRERVRKLLLTGGATLLALAANASGFSTDIEAWAFWLPAAEHEPAAIDHVEWQELLDTYLITATPDDIYRFDYAAVSAADTARLQNYLDQLAATDPRRYSRAEQLAYWINLYNALTVTVVAQHYPVDSIREIYGGLFNTGPWDEELITVAGQSLSLNDIEHRILRPIWRDPRIHYAVNCASLSCPNLAAKAYTAANTDALLTAGAGAYINHPRGVSFAADQLTLSSIYIWYATDFGDAQADLLQHLTNYAEPELAEKLNTFRLKSYKEGIQYDYDWRLNSPDY